MPVSDGYAEGLYADYSASSTGNILFEVQTLRQGPLAELGSATFGEVQSAVASATVENQGSVSVDITWTQGGGVDARGGRMTDSCGYF